MELDAVAVVEGLGGEEGDGEGGVEFADAAEGFEEDGAFGVELGGVSEVLVMAAAAAGEEGAGRGLAEGRGGEDFERGGAEDAAGGGGEAGADEFAGDDAGEEDDAAVEAGEGVAAVDEFFDGEVGGGGRMGCQASIVAEARTGWSYCAFRRASPRPRLPCSRGPCSHGSKTTPPGSVPRSALSISRDGAGSPADSPPVSAFVTAFTAPPILGGKCRRERRK